MKFGFVGINYKSAHLDVRDKTSFTDGMKMELFQKAENIGITQCMVLSTCNRSEVYFFYENNEEFQSLIELYCNMFENVNIKEYLIAFQGEDAIAYLFRIAAGLESLVLGEDQILGQVKSALDFSRTMGYSKKELSKVVRDAITCAKKVKTCYRISEHPLSVSYIGISELNRRCPIRGKKVLIIGSGKTAELALTYIYEYGAKHVIACSRTHAHAKALREHFQEIEIIEYNDRYLKMSESDIVVTATSSPHLVVKLEEIPALNNIIFLDLAAPRDVDCQIAELDGVELINLDTIQEIVRENQELRRSLVIESSSMIQEGVTDTLSWLIKSRMDHTICSLQQRCNFIVEDSYDYLEHKMELTEKEKKLLKKVLRASLLRLLREPIQELKQIDTIEKQEEIKVFVQQLFQI